MSKYGARVMAKRRFPCISCHAVLVYVGREKPSMADLGGDGNICEIAVRCYVKVLRFVACLINRPRVAMSRLG
jgi:hypothetical protein